jgi:hypothetical protein
MDHDDLAKLSCPLGGLFLADVVTTRKLTHPFYFTATGDSYALGDSLFRLDFRHVAVSFPCVLIFDRLTCTPENRG